MTKFEEQFAVNYYEWAKRKFQREVEDDFPTLARFRCTFSLRTYEFMSNLPAVQQRMYALARSKQSNPDAAEICGEPMTETERALLGRYHNRSVIKYPIIGAVPSGGPSKRELEIREAITKKELRAQHSNKVFRAAVLARVKEVLGGTPEIDQFETIKHVAKGDDWKITTSIALKGRFPLRYTQSLTSKRGLSQETSFSRWLGITGDTFWDLITTDVTGEAIEQLVTLCSRFISEGPHLLPEREI
jgi:hypothetical protein